jgi:hypothetical protein
MLERKIESDFQILAPNFCPPSRVGSSVNDSGREQPKFEQVKEKEEKENTHL